MDEEGEIDFIDEEFEGSEYDDDDFISDSIINPENITTFTNNYDKDVKNYKTSSILTKYEKTKVLCERAQQIENGSPPYIANFERFNNSYSIAVEEMNQKKIPFIIRRSMPTSKYFEYWKLKDMIY